MKKIKASTLRALVACVVLLVIAIGYFTCFGIGNLSGFGIDAFSLLCPLGYIESLLASKIFVPRALISFLAIVALVLILGRVFCAWVCPMSFLQKIFPGIKKKHGAAADEKNKLQVERCEASNGAKLIEDKTLERIGAGESEILERDDAGKSEITKGATEGENTKGIAKDKALEGTINTEEKVAKSKFGIDSRVGVLLGTLASAAIFGFPVFCLICPVGLTFATIYIIMRLFSFGEVTITLIVLPFILLVEVIFFRKWCSKICPLGALLSLISRGNKSFRPTIDNAKCLHSSQGIDCFACAKSCSWGINIRKPESSELSLNNCTKCRECSDHCPASAISFPALPKKTQRIDKK